VVDLRLFTDTEGYRSGVAIATVYFSGFSGIWLVFALFFQTGLGLSPLESGLAVTPLALGSSVSSAVAGRLVDRWARWVTVTGLSTVAVGLAVAAVVVRLANPSRVGLAMAIPLLVAGIGGGAVISPNTTLTLSNVPPRMAGVAGGLIQTGQRIGSALGTALLAAIFHAVAHGARYTAGISAALLCAVGLTLMALILAVRELRVSRST
jgi:MFS family permease